MSSAFVYLLWANNRWSSSCRIPPFLFCALLKGCLSDNHFSNQQKISQEGPLRMWVRFKRESSKIPQYVTCPSPYGREPPVGGHAKEWGWTITDVSIITSSKLQLPSSAQHAFKSTFSPKLIWCLSIEKFAVIFNSVTAFTWIINLLLQFWSSTKSTQCFSAGKWTVPEIRFAHTSGNIKKEAKKILHI